MGFEIIVTFDCARRIPDDLGTLEIAVYERPERITVSSRMPGLLRCEHPYAGGLVQVLAPTAHRLRLRHGHCPEHQSAWDVVHGDDYIGPLGDFRISPTKVVELRPLDLSEIGWQRDLFHFAARGVDKGLLNLGGIELLHDWLSLMSVVA